MVSTNDVSRTYSDEICKLFWWKPSHIIILVKKRRSTDPILNSYFIKLEKATTGGVL